MHNNRYDQLSLFYAWFNGMKFLAVTKAGRCSRSRLIRRIVSVTADDDGDGMRQQSVPVERIDAAQLEKRLARASRRDLVEW